MAGALGRYQPNNYRPRTGLAPVWEECAFCADSGFTLASLLLNSIGLECPKDEGSSWYGHRCARPFGPRKLGAQELVSTGGSAKIVASCVGLTGFSVALIAGIGADNPLDVAITRALMSMVVCMIVGAIVGAAGDVAMTRTIENLRRTGAAMIPGEPKQEPNGESGSGSEKQVTS